MRIPILREHSQFWHQAPQVSADAQLIIYGSPVFNVKKLEGLLGFAVKMPIGAKTKPSQKTDVAALALRF
jgi:hypothetical protein